MKRATTKLWVDGRYVCFPSPVTRWASAGMLDHLSDPENGDPAYLEYYENGQLAEVSHCLNGRIADSAFGEPATVGYNRDGEIDFAWSDTLCSYLSFEQTQAMFKSARVKRVEAAIAKLDQSVIPAGMRSPEAYIAAHAASV